MKKLIFGVCMSIATVIVFYRFFNEISGGIIHLF